MNEHHIIVRVFTAVALLVLGKRMGCLRVGSIPEGCQQFINYIQNVITSTQDILFGLPFHKIHSTRSWKMLAEALTETYRISMMHIEEKLKEIKQLDQQLTAEDGGPSENEDFLTYMIQRGNMSLEEVTINAGDLLAAGVDTVSVYACIRATMSSPHNLSYTAP